MVLIKEIELALKPKDTDVIEPEEEDLEVIAKSHFIQDEGNEEISPGAIRKHVEADMRVAYPGQPTSRKRVFKSFLKEKVSPHLSTTNESDYDEASDKEDSDLSDQDDNIHGSEDEVDSNDDEVDVEDEVDSNDDKVDVEDEVDSNDDEVDVEDEVDSNDNDDDEDSVDGDDSSDYGGSITGFEDSKVSDEEEEEEESEDDSKGINIFSAQARDIKSDIEKGRSIRNQLTIWEKLIECRIKLQPGLINTNKLYQCEALKEFKKHLNAEEEEIVSETYSVLSNLMKGLLELQDVTLNAAPEYREIKNLKRKNDLSTDEKPEEKKKRSEDFLQVIHEDFKPFKDTVIQKWNEKTKLSYGRMSKSDFSAFDQPTLKQIEEILLDRPRLLKRTQIKRSDYQILGKSKAVPDEVSNETSKTRDIQECDPEIFDDDDFYHKLLRDFIENKTSDASEFSKRGKQWLELQKLRSQMKAKVDTRASKGRKIRFTVHNKMVNFMAPVPSFSWSDEAKNELFKSLFGQALKQKG